MIQTTAMFGSAEEIIEYLQANGSGAKYWLITDSSSGLPIEVPLEPPMSAEEFEAFLDEASNIGAGRTDPSLKCDREDIYFDR